MMKRYLSVFTLLLFYSSLSAQYELYVNNKTGETSSFNGSIGYTSDCCESGTATLTENGPIIVTYSPSLNMGPEETKTWHGEIKPDIKGAPEPGSSVSAGFTIDYTFNYWTESGESLEPKTGTEKMDFIIYSIKLDADKKVFMCPGGQKEVTATEYPEGGVFEWTSESGSLTLTNSDKKTVTIKSTATKPGETKLKVKYTIEGVSTTKEIKIITLGIEITSFSKINVCDGDPVDVFFSYLPAGVSADEFAGCVKNLTVKTRPSVPSFGNPNKSTKLPMGRVDIARKKAKINAVFWYSTEQGHCNQLSLYKIKMKGECSYSSGIVESKERLLMSDASKSCIDGVASAVPPYFSSYPNVKVTNKKFPSGLTLFFANIEQGKFSKKVTVEIRIDTPAKSQFRKMIVREENYHAKQFKGATSIPEIKGMWNVKNVMDEARKLLKGKVFKKGLYANRAGKKAIRVAHNKELARSQSVFFTWNVRCRMEREAKSAIGASFRLIMPCAYKDCP